MRIKISITFLTCILYLLLSINVYSTADGFLYRLQMSLNSYGWPEEEVAPIMYAAQHMNWESMDKDHADVVAYSLQYCKRSGTEMTSGEKAEFAYHLAVAAMEMKAIGYEEDVITRVAVNTSREVIRTLNQYREEGSEEGLGEMIRTRIREQVCNEGTEAEQTKIMERIRNRTRVNSDREGKQNHGDGDGDGDGHGHGPQ